MALAAQIGSLMHISKEFVHPRTDNVLLNRYLETYRQPAIRWMNEVSERAHLGSIDRDTCVQIFDLYHREKFTTCDFGDYQGIVDNTPLTAALSMVIGTKISGKDNLIHMGLFQSSWSREVMIREEALILECVDYQVLPQTTISGFANVFLENYVDLSYREQVAQTCETFISLFIEDSNVLRFAPSTAAIATLLLAHVHLQLDYTDWLNSLPDDCLDVPNSTAFQTLPKDVRAEVLDVSEGTHSLQDCLLRHSEAQRSSHAFGYESSWNIAYSSKEVDTGRDDVLRTMSPMCVWSRPGSSCDGTYTSRPASSCDGTYMYDESSNDSSVYDVQLDEAYAHYASMYSGLSVPVSAGAGTGSVKRSRAVALSNDGDCSAEGEQSDIKASKVVMLSGEEMRKRSFATT